MWPKACVMRSKVYESVVETDINKTGLTVELPTIKEPVEQEIANFSTTIKSKGAGRLNNIRITCSKINGQIVDSMQEFSFEQIVGKSTPEEGYQKADIFVNKTIERFYKETYLPNFKKGKINIEYMQSPLALVGSPWNQASAGGWGEVFGPVSPQEVDTNLAERANIVENAAKKATEKLQGIIK